MKQETAKAVIDRLQGEAGYATGGYVDRLVFSGLDVHEMLNEIEQVIESDKLSVEKLQEQLNTAKKALTEVAGGHTVEDAIFNHQLIASNALAAIGNEGSGDE